MVDQIAIAEYNITADPQFQNERFGIMPKLQSQMKALFCESKDKKNKKIIDKLLRLIQQYPSVPQLKNYLSTAYEIRGNFKKSKEITQWILAEHPDYLFGLINQAIIFINDNEFDKVPEILGKEMDLKALYPTRDLFHLDELTSFLKTAVYYFVSIKDVEEAEKRYDLLHQIAPDHKYTDMALNDIFMLRMEKSAERLKLQREKAIMPKMPVAPPDTGITEGPVFTHPGVECLYKYGMDIPRDELRQMLALPHYSLASDLEKILDDAIIRYHYFEKRGWEEENSFVLHALFLLKEIHATGSLPKIFSLLSYNSDVTDFWIGDHITETVWQCIYGLGIYQVPELEKFLKKPSIHTYCKTNVTKVLAQIVLHHPERKGEIVAVFSDVMECFLKAVPEDNLIDSDFNGLMICDILDARLDELLPLIKKLFDKGYVSENVCGTFDDVEYAIKSSSNRDYKRKLENIFELYDRLVSPGNGEEEEDYYDDEECDPGEGKYTREAPKVGRNDLCPCGSGKKYKKCCMK